RGLTFRNYFVSDSLCCPSRASIFTGDFPHDTGVYRNVGRHGRFIAFQRPRGPQRSLAPVPARRGYRPASAGKYLRACRQRGARPPMPRRSIVPRGWSEWDVAGWGYPEYDYAMNVNGRLQYFGNQPSDYLTNVLAPKGVGFIGRAALSGDPF